MSAPIDLTNFVPAARAFLTELAACNDRDWFRAERMRYDADLKRPAERILAELAPEIGAVFGQTPRTKLFRPHRDVRFSEDKTPYHTHLHMMWSLPDGRSWYFGLSPDYATAGGGVMQFDTLQLDTYRQAVAGPEGETLGDIIDGIGGRLDAPALKRVPQPWPDDHPRAALLRRKGIVIWLDGLEESLTPDPVAGLKSAFRRLHPLQEWLGNTL